MAVLRPRLVALEALRTTVESRGVFARLSRTRCSAYTTETLPLIVHLKQVIACTIASLYILTLSILLNSACGTSTEPTKSLISLPEGNETKVNDLDQTQLDELCSQAQQAGLDYMEQHQANLCGVTALLAEEQLGMDCDG
jgi:hypothetical protein